MVVIYTYRINRRDGYEKKVILPLVFFVSIGLVLCVNVQAETIKLRVGHDLPPFTAPGIAYQVFADEINKKADGRVGNGVRLN